MSNQFETQTPDEIKLCRKDSGLTRKECADLVGVKEATWKSWELGRRPAPSGVLERFAKAVWDKEDAERDARLEAESAKQRADLARIRMAAVAPSAPKPTTPFVDDFDELVVAAKARMQPSPEVERICAEVLANGCDYTPQDLVKARKQFMAEQQAVIDSDARRHAAEVKRNAEILAQD